MKTVSITYTSKLSSRVQCEDCVEEDQYLIIKINKNTINKFKVTEVPDNNIEGVLLD